MKYKLNMIISIIRRKIKFWFLREESADDASLNRANTPSIRHAQYGIIQVGVLYYFRGIEKVLEHGEM